MITCACGATGEPIPATPVYAERPPVGWSTITLSGHPITNTVICGDCRRRVLRVITPRRVTVHELQPAAKS